MKIRTNYVSNSSSSSFLVSEDVSHIVPCIKLSKEIWKSLDKNHIDWNGKRLHLSELSKDWWLTTFIYDSNESYEKINNLKNTKIYLSGNDTPYDFYDNKKGYTVFRKDFTEFFISNNDLLNKSGDIPEALFLRNELKKIIKNKKLNKSQKIEAISYILDF